MIFTMERNLWKKHNESVVSQVTLSLMLRFNLLVHSIVAYHGFVEKQTDECVFQQQTSVTQL